MRASTRAERLGQLGDQGLEVRDGCAQIVDRVCVRARRRVAGRNSQRYAWCSSEWWTRYPSTEALTVTTDRHRSDKGLFQSGCPDLNRGPLRPEQSPA